MSKRNRYQQRDTATLERSKRSGLALASMASYDGAMPDKTRMMSNRIGTNPNSAYAQQQRVTLMWQAEDLVKNSDWVSVCYSLKQYCQPIGYLAQTGDPALDSEVNQYMREVMKRGGINQSALSAFSCAAHVEMPVRGDSILERYDDETQLRFIVRCADQIGELYRFVNPASYGAEAFVQPPAPSVRYIAGIFLAPNGMNEAFKIYERGYNQTYLNPQIVPACNVIFFQDNLFDGHRGVTKFAPAIQSIQKRNKIWQSGMDSMAIQSKIAAIASNASGSPDPLDYETTTNSDGTITYTEKMADGAVVKYQFSDGDSYQFMKSEAPGPALLQGLDYSDERTCLSLGFPKAFLISARDGGGAPTRFDMSRAGREIMRLRNDVYLPRLEKMAYLFLMDGIARKKLPARAGVLNGNWHWPSLPTADAFRDDKSDVEAMRAGLTTRTAIIAKNGDGTFEDVLARGTQEAIAIEIATQDANRELVKRGYKPTVADLNIAQDTANPAQQPQGESPAKATATLAEWDESKHPRGNKDNAGEFGPGGGGAKKEDAPKNESAAKTGDRSEVRSKRAEVGDLHPATKTGKGKDSTLTLADGSPLPAHISPASIPPAYAHNIRVSKDPNADVWAISEDAEGNPKRVYNPKFLASNQDVKWNRVNEGVDSIDSLRSQIHGDSNSGKNKEEADASWLMSAQATRPGSEEDTKGNKSLWNQKVDASNFVLTDAKKGPKKVSLKAGDSTIPIRDEGAREEITRRIKENLPLENAGFWLKSYGATTLEGRHIVPDGDGARLQFMGKEGVWHDHKVADPNLAKMLLERKATAGDTGKLFATNYGKVANYVGGLGNGSFSPKDLRTIRANELAANIIGDSPRHFDTDDERKSFIKSVAEKVSGVLGNRPQQALESYINPATFDRLKMKQAA